MYEHVHVDISESNDIFLEIFVVENVIDTNQESEKELSISKEDLHLKLTYDKVDEAIVNDMTNSHENDVDYNEVSYAYFFSSDIFDDHSNLYYDDVVNDHMSYDELLNAFEELFVESKKIINLVAILFTPFGLPYRVTDIFGLANTNKPCSFPLYL